MCRHSFPPSEPIQRNPRTHRWTVLAVSLPAQTATVTGYCAAFDVAPETLRQRGRHGNEARSAAIYLSRKLSDTPGRQIGTYFGGIGPSAVSMMVTRAREARKESQAFRTRLAKAEAALRKK